MEKTTHVEIPGDRLFTINNLQPLPCRAVLRFDGGTVVRFDLAPGAGFEIDRGAEHLDIDMIYPEEGYDGLALVK